MKRILKGIGVSTLVLLNVTSLMAQGNGVAALEKANSEILSYIELVYDYQKGKITFDQIFSVFSQHKIDCKEIDCACKTMDISKVVGKDGNIDKELASEYFSVVGLYEIKKSIHYFYQNNTKKNYLQIFILLHTEHMFTIKKDYNLTLYIISQYLSHKIAEKFDFLTIFYLYEYRYKLYHKITKLKRKKANFKETAREKLKLRQNIIFRHHFVEYTKILEKINELLDNCCQNLKKILHSHLFYNANHTISMIHSKQENSNAFTSRSNAGS
jgi:hypothetical protein